MEHMQYYHTFIDNEIAQVGCTVCARYLKYCKRNMQAEFELLTFYRECLMNTSKDLKCHELCAVSM